MSASLKNILQSFLFVLYLFSSRGQMRRKRCVPFSFFKENVGQLLAQRQKAPLKLKDIFLKPAKNVDQLDQHFLKNTNFG
jgi:hypothetical protein